MRKSVLWMWALFAVILIVLKLTGLCTVGWLWVLAPLWMPVMAVAMCLLGMFIMCLIIDE